MKGEEIALSSRLINLADVVEVFARAGGVEAAIAVARERSGTQFDPELVDAFCEQAPMLFGELDLAPSWEAVIEAEPSLGREIAGEELDDALESIGEFAELKSPWTSWVTSRAVARPGRRSGDELRPPDADGRCCAERPASSRPRSARRVEHGLGQARAADPLGAGAGAHCIRT